MNRLLEPDRGPPGGWFWIHPGTSRRIEAGNMKALFARAREYNSANGIAINRTLEQDIIDQICKRNPTICFDEAPPTPGELLINLVKAAATWAANGMPVASKDKISGRLEICQGCQYWQNDIWGRLGKCTKCGCSGMKLHVETGVCPIGKW